VNAFGNITCPHVSCYPYLIDWVIRIKWYAEIYDDASKCNLIYEISFKISVTKINVFSSSSRKVFYTASIESIKGKLLKLHYSLYKCMRNFKRVFLKTTFFQIEHIFLMSYWVVRKVRTDFEGKLKRRRFKFLISFIKFKSFCGTNFPDDPILGQSTCALAHI